MSTATLNVWVTNIGDPCTISNVGPIRGYDWKVAVLHCDGRTLNWSEGRYRFHHDDPWTPIRRHVRPGDPARQEGWWYENILTRDGHVEIEVPPGCYVVVASLHNWIANGVLYGNWVTDHAIVQTACGHDACITLYAPSIQRCMTPLLEMVVPLLERQGIIHADQAERAVEVINEAFGPLRASPFERQELGALRRAFQQMGSGEPGGEPDPEGGEKK